MSTEKNDLISNFLPQVKKLFKKSGDSPLQTTKLTNMIKKTDAQLKNIYILSNTNKYWDKGTEIILHNIGIKRKID